MEYLVAGLIIVGVLYYAFSSRTNLPDLTETDAPVEKPEPAPEPAAPDLASMTKVQIDELALSQGIKLDRRRTKARMIEQYIELTR